MKSEKTASFIIFIGIIVLSVFIVTFVYNILPKNVESNSYYVKVEEEMSAKIEALDINDNYLTIITSGDAYEYCAKTTKSLPAGNSLCWKKIENNKARIAIYDFKKYYIWVRDVNGNISSPMSINKKDK